jgi:hypothetical protein
MAQRRGLGRRTQLGVIDDGYNPYGPRVNWSVFFTPDVLALGALGEVEVYHIALNGPVGGSFLVELDQQPWDYVNQGWNNAWDPSQPLLLEGGQRLDFHSTLPFTAGPYDLVTNIQPQITLWLRLPAVPPPVLPGLGG